MASVLGYWQLPADDAEFIDYVSKTGDIFAIDEDWKRTREEWRPLPIREFLWQRQPPPLMYGVPVGFRFGPERFARDAEIETKVRDGEIMYAVAYMKPCLISYSPGGCWSGRDLHRSNLHSYSSYPDKTASAVIQKDKEFIDWQRKIFNWVRRRTPEKIELNGFPYRATKLAKCAVDRGEFVPVF